MKRFLIPAVIAAATLTAQALAADVGVSVSIGQPGFYGRLDIGDFPQPRVLYHQPIIVERGIPMNRPPVYLRVPPGHAKNWKKHCHEYNACGERVLFVHDDWYEREYVPRYQEKHRDRGHDNQGKGRGDDHGNKGHGNKHERD
ncbi:hypothetical protein [Sulfuricurvum sp.]|uniref:hypothetical protein n=1 Tax=Sulfuricurvum sp. TaxID=2025608 RepID=UPI003C3B3503